MRDFTGKEIKVGDRIGYIHKGELVEATVLEFKHKVNKWAVVKLKTPIQRSSTYRWAVGYVERPPIVIDKLRYWDSERNPNTSYVVKL